MWIGIVLVVALILSVIDGNFRGAAGALIIIGLAMAWSGFSARARMKAWERQFQAGMFQPGLTPRPPAEYNYHVWFRTVWWIPVVIGLLVLIFI